MATSTAGAVLETSATVSRCEQEKVAAGVGRSEAGIPDVVGEKNINVDVEPEAYMERDVGVERAEEHVRQLLQVFRRQGDCRKFLAALPLFQTCPTLTDIQEEFAVAVKMLTADRVT